MKRSRATVKKFEEVAAKRKHFLTKRNKFKQVLYNSADSFLKLYFFQIQLYFF